MLKTTKRRLDLSHLDLSHLTSFKQSDTAGQRNQPEAMHHITSRHAPCHSSHYINGHTLHPPPSPHPHTHTHTDIPTYTCARTHTATHTNIHTSARAHLLYATHHAYFFSTSRATRHVPSCRAALKLGRAPRHHGQHAHGALVTALLARAGFVGTCNTHVKHGYTISTETLFCPHVCTA